MSRIEEMIFKIKKICAAKNMRIACAESITGGNLSYAFTKIEGASEYFKASIVAYTDEMKLSLLKINPETIKKHTSVSKETCEEMARNICKLTNADIGLAATGYAGPDKDNTKTGNVFIGICLRGQTRVWRLKLNGNRRQIQNQTTIEILNRLIELIEEK